MIPLITITGPTASGKTNVAVRLAQEFDGEIICADSRTLYRGLDVGTAKPTAAERGTVPHHLLDMVDPDEQYNLARFQQDAQAAIADIRSRGKVPFLVGGSGLYIDSIVLEYKLGAAPDMIKRAQLEAMELDELLQYCTKNNINLPQNQRNKRYVIRAIEQDGVNGDRKVAPDDSIAVVAINTDAEILKHRIQQRAKAIFDAGVIDEAKQVAGVYGWDVAPLQAPAYKAVRRYLNNEIPKDEAVAAFAHDDWQLARKQMTWLRRNNWLVWKELGDVETYVRSILTQAGRG